MEGIDRHHPQEIEPFDRGGQHLQKGHGCLKSARMTGQGKEQGAGTAEQSGADHPDGQDVEPLAAEQPFGNGAGEKAPALGGNARAAQAGALFTWGDRLEQAGKNIAAQVVDQALAGNGVLLAFGGNGGKFLLDALTGEGTVENVNQEQLPARERRRHLQGVTGNPVRIDRSIVG